MGELVVFGAFERSDLHHALLSGNEEQVITLLDQNKELVNQPLDWNEWTPLHVAVTTSIMNIVELLLRYNANPNASCAGGDTPLHLAALHGHLDVVVLLLQNGALVNVLNQSCWTPLHWATIYNRQRVLEVLVEHGANVNAVTATRSSALHHAAESGSVNAANLLIQNGADVTATDESGLTPLHVTSSGVCHGPIPAHIVLQRRPKLVQFLVEHGANVSAVDKRGRTARDIAAESSFTAAISVFDQEMKRRLRAFLLGTHRPQSARRRSVVSVLPVDILSVIASRVVV
eukprot:c15948_g1_i2.p1 GENE.c15948_g1_i2~~c15948_g1_i2.p1  ORF type:complete len:296 (+),score=45.90 c15948_g1_i2:26-889(+)